MGGFGCSLSPLAPKACLWRVPQCIRVHLLPPVTQPASNSQFLAIARAMETAKWGQYSAWHLPGVSLLPQPTTGDRLSMATFKSSGPGAFTNVWSVVQVEGSPHPLTEQLPLLRRVLVPPAGSDSGRQFPHPPQLPTHVTLHRISHLMFPPVLALFDESPNNWRSRI